MPNPAASDHGNRAPVVEVRTYRLKPGRRDEFVELFVRRAGPPQRDLGIRVIGPLLDTGDPDVVVWLRAFPSEPDREPLKASFYGGPVWKEELEELIMPMLDDYSAVVCEIPTAFLDGPLRPRDRQARDGQAPDGQARDRRTQDGR